MTVWFWTIAAAWAQDPAPEVPDPDPPAPEAPAPDPAPAAPAPAAPGEEADVEITVWGQLAIQQARDQVVREIEGLGYERVRRGNGRTVFRGKYARVKFYDDGRIQVGRLVAGLAPPPREVTEPPPRPGLPTRSAPMEPGIGPWFWALPSERKIQPLQQEILEATRDEVQAYLEVVRRTALEEMLLTLPDRLDELWTAGAPLSAPGAPIEGADARRREALTFWATRTDTPEGHRAAEVVESWLAAVVQASEHPITADERQRFEEQAATRRKLPE